MAALLLPMSAVGPLIIVIFVIALIIMLFALKTVSRRKYNIEEFYKRHPHQTGQGGEVIEDDPNTISRT